MGIQINGQTDTISASDGGLVISGQELNNVTDINASGIGTFGSGVVLTGGDITLGTGTTISAPTTNEFVVSTNGSERLRVDSSGNIGVGTTNPQYKLDVNGNLNIKENVYINGTLINLSSIDYGLITGSVDSSTDYGSIV